MVRFSEYQGKVKPVETCAQKQTFWPFRFFITCPVKRENTFNKLTQVVLVIGDLIREFQTTHQSEGPKGPLTMQRLPPRHAIIKGRIAGTV